MKLVDVKKAAEITGWKESTLYQKIYRREIEYVKMGRSLRFDESYLLRLVANNTVPALCGDAA